MVAPFRSQPNTGAVIEPEAALLSLFLGDFQPFAPPDPFDPLVVHVPACVVQQARHHPIAVSPILTGQFDDIFGEALFVGSSLRNLTLGGAVLTENPAGATL